ncbi:MAG: rod shape-determining protein MreD [Chitinophagaceae bacterium]|nr:MAG: rod shape-determining protein MreD [Chitinophagaceae bacterium]
MKRVLNWIFIGAALIFMQSFLLDRIAFSYYIFPMIYPLLLLIMPFKMSKWGLMFLGFGIGLIMDILSNTGGMHASAMLVLAFFRNNTIRLLEPPIGYGEDNVPGINNPGVQWFFFYSFMLLFLHHLVFFSWEIFSLNRIIFILFKTIFSTFFSVFIIMLLSFLFKPSEK